MPSHVHARNTAKRSLRFLIDTERNPTKVVAFACGFQPTVKAKGPKAVALMMRGSHTTVKTFLEQMYWEDKKDKSLLSEAAQRSGLHVISYGRARVDGADNTLELALKKPADAKTIARIMRKYFKGAFKLAFPWKIKIKALTKAEAADLEALGADWGEPETDDQTIEARSTEELALATGEELEDQVVDLRSAAEQAAQDPLEAAAEVPLPDANLDEVSALSTEEDRPAAQQEAATEPLSEELAERLAAALEQKLGKSIADAYAHATRLAAGLDLPAGLLEGFLGTLETGLRETLLAMPEAERDKALDAMIGRLYLKLQNPDNIEASAVEREMAVLSGELLGETVLPQTGKGGLLGNILDVAELNADPITPEEVAHELFIEALGRAEQMELPYDLTTAKAGNVFSLVTSKWPKNGGDDLIAEIEKIRSAFRTIHFSNAQQLRGLLMLKGGAEPTGDALTELRLRNRLYRAMRRLNTASGKVSSKIEATKKAGEREFIKAGTTIAEMNGNWQVIDELNREIQSKGTELASKLAAIIKSSPIMAEDLVAASEMAGSSKQYLDLDSNISVLELAASVWDGAPGGVVDVIRAQFSFIQAMLQDATDKIAQT